SQTQQGRRPRSLPQHCECSSHSDKEKEFNVYRAWCMKTETAELGNVIHQVVVTEVRPHMFVQPPSVRINKGRQQRGEAGWSETASGVSDRIYEKDGRTQQKTAMKIRPKSRKQRQE